MISKNKKEDAVSPVVGVMLMLVVTIIIAAVVATFAGGLTEATSKTPIAMIDVDGVDSDGNILMIHRGGDTFRLSDVYLELKNGNDGIPKICKFEYGMVDYPCLLSTKGYDPSVSAGDYFKIANPEFGAGNYINYRLIDSNSGNSITSGTMTIPTGVKATRATLTTLAISAYDTDYVDSLTLTVNESATFWANAYNELNELKSAAGATFTATGPQEYHADASGTITFTEAGTYTVTAKLNDLTSSKHIPAGGDMNKFSTLVEGGSIAVTVNPAPSE